MPNASRIPPVEEFARRLAPETTASVRQATAKLTANRITALALAFEDPDAARRRAAEIKAFVLDNLKTLLLQFEEKCQENGIQVHWANDAHSAQQIILEICKSPLPLAGCIVPGGGRGSGDGGSGTTEDGDPSGTPTLQYSSTPLISPSNQAIEQSSNPTIVKAKSMATEEIHLNRFLQENGYKPVETDLGEYVVQLDHETPSHIVAPIIHKNRKDVADAFEREGLGPRSEDPETLTIQARERLRVYFKEAKIGISGINFGVAETGRLVLVENEGNNRLSTTAPDVHIAVMGIEKIIPREADLPLFLRLLACSATAQQLTTYTHLISGPRKDEQDGPTQIHLILLDNGRSKVLNGPYRDILRCIRCGACLNVCPVYRQASGHAYGHVYSGPLGAVLAPALEGVDKMGHLAKASSLCGACEEVCPVQIPIPKMLLQIRDESLSAGLAPAPEIPWHLYTKAATSGWKWRMGLKLLPMAERFPHPLKDAWAEHRALPHRVGRNFRSWWNEHK